MGNALSWSNVTEGILHPDTTPRTDSYPNFDAHEGFEYKRKGRENKNVEAEMEALRIETNRRDYCAHLMKPYLACKNKNFPWFFKCEHEAHAYHMCSFQDQELRIREWERERRMRIRQKEELGAVNVEPFSKPTLRG